MAAPIVPILLARLVLGGLRPPTGRTVHSDGLRRLPTPWALRVVRFDKAPGFYLLYDDEQGRELTDTYHDTLEGAFAQAEWEFEVLTDEWERFDRW